MDKEIPTKKIAHKHFKKISSFSPSSHYPLKRCLEKYAQDVARIIERNNKGFQVKVGTPQEGSHKIFLTAITHNGLKFSMSYNIFASKRKMTYSLVFFVSKMQRKMNIRLKRATKIPLHEDFGRPHGIPTFIQAESHEGLLRSLSSVPNILRYLPKQIDPLNQ